MEQETILKEILNTLKEHSRQMNTKLDESIAGLEKKMDKRFAEMDNRFAEMDKRFDHVDKKFDNLNKKVDGLRIDLHETQETAEFAASKVIQHEKKLREISMQYRMTSHCNQSQNE
ncbi:hypothetical protein [Oceanobacillus alkalisoli]|uniref:hypothetical protein n=1 Tax=Oceanobacillus alkalisoli TaxID=2925113 RepID=UPI001EF12491|nr:hypothetical protein [Oceanobacillus alkalisoli]MCF3944912.1 hypothetical protein [Oceanobacillus alkalisoli]MCG5105196.1 hypothetical protein [Oceanobacillus alkalisoli]